MLCRTHSLSLSHLLLATVSLTLVLDATACVKRERNERAAVQQPASDQQSIAVIAIKANLCVEGNSLRIGEISTDIGKRTVYSIAIGKAAAKMAAGLTEILDERLSAGVITTNDTRLKANHLGTKWQIFYGGHPEPNESRLAAAHAA